MRLADVPNQRMLNGRMPQKHPLVWRLRGYPPSIQNNPPPGYDWAGLPDSIAPGQNELERAELWEPGVHPAFGRALWSAAPPSARVVVKGNPGRELGFPGFLGFPGRPGRLASVGLAR
jgi:hypothetical protein